MATRDDPATTGRPSAYKVVIFAIAAVATARLLPHLIPELMSVFLALVFGLVLDLPVSFLARHGVRRSLGAAGVAIFCGGAVVGAALLVIPTVSHQLAGLTSQHQNMAQLLATRINSLTAHLPVKVGPVNPSQLAIPKLLKAAGGTHLVTSVSTTAGLIVIAFFAAVFAVAAPDPLAARLLSLIPAARREAVAAVTGAVLARLRRWLVGQLILSVTVGVTTYLLLILTDCPFAVLFAVLAAVLELIPNLGVIIASALPVLLVALEHPDHLVLLLVGIIVIHQIEGRALSPLVLGRAVEIHQSLLTFIVVIAGVILGPTGVIMAVPLSAAAFTAHDELAARRHPDPATTTGEHPAWVPAPPGPDAEPPPLSP